MFQDLFYTSICSAATLQSDKKGFFQQFADTTTVRAGTKWIEQFDKLSSNKERILKCYNDEKIYEEVHGTLDNVQEIYRGKSTLMSVQKRKEADHLISNGKIERALLIYNQSVIRAPPTGTDLLHDDGLTLTLALWGRSNALFQLGKYSLCLQDIQLCLKEKLPTNFKLDAYWRMAECYCRLGIGTKAQISLNIVDKISQEKEFSNVREEWKMRIHLKKEYISNCCEDEQKISESSTVIPRLTLGEHDQLPGASKVLKLIRNKDVGRHLVASTAIKAGDTILLEDPYVACLLPEKFGTYCHHCFKRLQSAIPCSNCSGIAFCSLTCQHTAEKTYHKYECKYMDIMIGSGMSILCFVALRIITQNELQYFQEAEKAINHGNSNHPYYNIYHLENHSYTRKGVDFFHRTLMALLLLTILRKSGYFRQFRSGNKQGELSKMEIVIGDMLLRNLEVLQFNAHEIYETVKFKEKSKQPRPAYIGAALYKTAAFFNHDCYPAIMRYFVGKKMIIKALRPIAESEIIPENYGPTFTKFALADRQRTLSSRYWFHCKCTACIENWPLLENLSEDNFTERLITNNCVNETSKLNENVISCEKNKLVQEETLKKIENLQKMFENGVKLFKNEDYQAASELLSQYSNSMNTLYKVPIKNVCLSHEILRTIWSNDGNSWII